MRVLPAWTLVTATLASGGAAAAGAGGLPGLPRVLSPGQHAYSSQVGSVRLDYLLYAPAAYARDSGRRWPLVVFLHGSGERGSDPLLLERQPLPETLATTTSFPAIVLSPQLPASHTWWTDLLGSVDALLRRVEARYRVDPHRVYLTGLSLGGFGTWAYALEQPRRFAALVPIAGGWVQGSRELPRDLCTLRGLPIWAFAGSADTIVYPYQTQVLVQGLRACGSRTVRLTLYRGVDHWGTWTRAYADPALWRWLFAQRRP